MAIEEEEEYEIGQVSSDSDVSNDEDEDDDYGGEVDSESRSSGDDRKSQNVDALLSGNLVVKRQPLIPRVLSVSEGALVARRPFKPPCSNGYKDNNELTRRLSSRKRFVPWGSAKPVLVAINTNINVPSDTFVVTKDNNENLPPGVEPLVLWQSDELDEKGDCMFQIEVDPLLVKYLRPHQREGVQFMFDCVSGVSSSDGISGCILADDMGLGKTLQSITLLYTLLRQGFDGKPIVKRALIVTPTSLVANWESEINKWVGERVKLLSLCESTRADVLSGIDNFLKACSHIQVLIISYETFRMHASKFVLNGSCDLLICDEAHRLKNGQTLTNQALAGLPCKRRVLLSGTPMQNDLEEFFAMVNFTNPGVLGDVTYFRKYYENPIIIGREPLATVEEKKLGAERSAELSQKVNQFILRRTNALLSNHLPPKIVQVVCCKLTPLQIDLYNHFIQSKNVRRAITEDAKHSKILAYITALKKLCNHPKLIYDTIKSGSSGTSGFEDCSRFFPAELFSGRSGTWTGGGGIWIELSGKMHVLARLLGHLRQKTDDRIVLVSNYTQTLDLFAQLCRERRYPFVRLDGSTSIGKRQKLVNQFNDPSRDEFVFLLSSKAGGCGLNLIGGNRLVLFDPDWNPANDKQAAARVWRDGQKKRVYIYRFLSTGTIEEKVYQRQMSKEGLQKVIQQEQGGKDMLNGNLLSTEDLRDLFILHENVRSDIHENMNCARCETNSINSGVGLENVKVASNDQGSTTITEDIGGFAETAGCLNKLKASEKQIGAPLEEDLGNWGHHFSSDTIPDAILQASAGDDVTFVFTNQVDGKLVPVESAVRSSIEQATKQSSSSLLCSNKFLTLNQTTKTIPTISNRSTKLMRTSPNGIQNLQKKSILMPSKHSAIKSRCVDTNTEDDDFV